MTASDPGPGPAPIAPEIFDHLVRLAALELEPGEAEYLRQQLNGQLRAIRELEAIQIPEGLPITSHGVPYTPATSQPLRPDRMQPFPEVEAILQQAPQVEDRYIAVPDIPRTELE